MVSTKKKRCEQARNRGFTLIELMVVIAIISLLSAILVPALKTARIRAAEVICLHKLKQQGVIIFQYASDWDGHFPEHTNWTPCWFSGGSELVQPLKPYVDDPNILYCYVSKQSKDSHGISTPDAIAWEGEYGGWDSYLEGEANFAAIGYDWLINFTSFLTPEDPAGSIEYFGQHKRAAKASDVTSGMALVKDLSHRGLFSLAEAQAYSWEGLYFDVNITGGECTHSSNVGGINVLYGGLNAEKRTWAQLEVQMAQYTSTWGGAGNFYYW